MSADDVLDCNYSLTHLKDNEQATSGDPPIITATSIAEIARSVLPVSVAKSIVAGRYFVYSAIRALESSFQSDCEDRLLAHRLANRQNKNYRPTNDRLKKGVLQSYDDILHASSLEGGCSLIKTGAKVSPFLRDFIANQLSNTYLPLLISELHSHYWLLSQTEQLSDPHSEGGVGGERDLLERLNLKLLNFTRFFHYPLPSRLTPHNEFHSLWQSTLEIEKLLEFLTSTAREAAEEARKRQLTVISYASAGISGLVVTQHIMDVVREKQLENNFAWQKRLFIDRTEALKQQGTGLQSGTLQKIDSEISEIAKLAGHWEDYYYIGSLSGLILGCFVAWYFRIRH